MTRPGAPFAGGSLWQELQSPLVWGFVMTRSRPLATTLAVNGSDSAAPLKKLPAAFVVRDSVLPAWSVMTTVIPVDPLPVSLEVPTLRIFRVIGQSISGSPDECTSEVTKRGWVFVKCGSGEDGFYAKVVAIHGEIITQYAAYDGGREEIPTPCDSRVVLHALVRSPAPVIPAPTQSAIR